MWCADSCDNHITNTAQHLSVAQNSLAYRVESLRDRVRRPVTRSNVRCLSDNKRTKRLKAAIKGHRADFAVFSQYDHCVAGSMPHSKRKVLNRDDLCPFAP